MSLFVKGGGRCLEATGGLSPYNYVSHYDSSHDITEKLKLPEFWFRFPRP